MSDIAAPPRIIGRSCGWEVGSRLYTKDGRKCGNAVIVEPVFLVLKRSHAWVVVTDDGTEMTATYNDLNELFHPPEWRMDPRTAPGYVKWMLNRNRPTYGEHV